MASTNGLHSLQRVKTEGHFRVSFSSLYFFTFKTSHPTHILQIRDRIYNLRERVKRKKCEIISGISLNELINL